jgi:hypothetical protein
VKVGSGSLDRATGPDRIIGAGKHAKETVTFLGPCLMPISSMYKSHL